VFQRKRSLMEGDAKWPSFRPQRLRALALRPYFRIAQHDDSPAPVSATNISPFDAPGANRGLLKSFAKTFTRKALWHTGRNPRAASPWPAVTGGLGAKGGAVSVFAVGHLQRQDKGNQKRSLGEKVPRAAGISLSQCVVDASASMMRPATLRSTTGCSADAKGDQERIFEIRQEPFLDRVN